MKDKKMNVKESDLIALFMNLTTIKVWSGVVEKIATKQIKALKKYFKEINENHKDAKLPWKE